MIRLDYKFAPAWSSKTQLTDLSVVDEAALRYDLLLGDIVFETDSCDFSAPWGWIPIIDFSVSLRQIIDDIAAHRSVGAVFEFTESDATLRFERTNDKLMISASYVHCVSEVPLDEFVSAVDLLLRHLIRSIEQTYPSLLQNKKLPALLAIE